MPFISYAQNYEDVILWRALHDVDGGFYVDVGAADPDEYSVTRAFYERGWSGINVEPLEEYFDKLAEARPRDTNLRVAAARDPGLRVLHTFPGTGLSTFDSEVATRHRTAGLQACDTLVPVLTLGKIVEDCRPAAIHFLKIDVEGAEAEVLEGFDLNHFRPWIILVEATEPNSPTNAREGREHTRTVQKWEQLITNCGYEFGYFDGLNCFYVAGEKSGLKERLAVPPNVFDDFIRWPEWSSGERAASIEQELLRIQAHAQWLESVSSDSTTRCASLEQELLRVQAHAQWLESVSSDSTTRCASLEQELLRVQAHAQWLESVSNDATNGAEEMRIAIEIERNFSATVKNALQVEQAQVSSLNGILAADRIQIDRLLTSVRILETQLATPSLDRAFGRMFRRLHDQGNRLTGGGLRALAHRVRIKSRERTTLFLRRHPRLLAVIRSALKPFPKLTAKLTPLSTQPDAVIIQSEAASTSIDLLPGQAQRVEMYLSASGKEGVIRFETNADGVKPRGDSRELFFQVRILHSLPAGLIRPLDGFSFLEANAQFPHVWAVARRADLKVPATPSAEQGPAPLFFELSTLNLRTITISSPVCEKTDSQSRSNDAVAATLPASVRSTYLKLKAAIATIDVSQ